MQTAAEQLCRISQLCGLRQGEKELRTVRDECNDVRLWLEAIKAAFEKACKRAERALVRIETEGPELELAMASLVNAIERDEAMSSENDHAATNMITKADELSGCRVLSLEYEYTDSDPSHWIID